ncbi:MAG: inorganic diphosphatase [Anaeroplasmataceae bacterium]|nr:inorganic diphosphatase [Anaeroplasmataceae bacterium]
MLNKIVDVIIDRPIHTTHPKHKDIFYEVNYGYIPNTISPVDNEEIDAYVLGVEEPITTYRGRVIAIIHRINDEDKLIVANQWFSEEEIIKKTYFQEKYFKSYIEMAYPINEKIS